MLLTLLVSVGRAADPTEASASRVTLEYSSCTVGICTPAACSRPARRAPATLWRFRVLRISFRARAVHAPWLPRASGIRKHGQRCHRQA